MNSLGLVRWGILGASGHGQNMIPVIQTSDHSTVQALMVRDLSHAESLASKHRVPEFHDSVESLLANPSVDALYICTPDEMHACHAILAARAGKHILCEKPMALTLRDCEETIEACRAANVKLMPGFMSRFHRHHKHIRDLIQTGELGKIVQVRVQCSFWYAPDGSWRQQSGGALWDLASHGVDLLRFFLGEEIVEVQGIVDSIVHDYPANDTATLLLRSTGGTIGVVDVSFAILHSPWSLEVYGTEGSVKGEKAITVLGTQPQGEITRGDGQTEMIVSEDAPYTNQFGHFAQCILEDQEPEVTGRDGFMATKILLAAEESAVSGRRIKIV